MRQSVHLLSIITVALVPIACGGASQGSTPQNPSPVAIGSDPVMGDGPVHLTPVDEPKHIVVVARWNSPRRVFDTFQQWLGLPIPIDQGIDEIFRARGLTSVIEMDAPVDFLVALDPQASGRDSVPQPFLAFSVGLRSVYDTRQLLNDNRDVREIGEGVFRVDLGSDYDPLPCFISSSLGASSARLVCGPRDKDIEALHPYMTRNLPVATMSDKDLVGEVRFAPIREQYGNMLPIALEMGASVLSHELGTGDRNLDRAIADTTSALGQELLALSNDLDTLRIEGSLDPAARNLSGEVSLGFKSRTAWFSQRFFDHADKAGPPPSIFWRAPAASSTVYFDRGVDGKHYAAIRRQGGALVDAYLAHGNFPAADRKAVVELVERIFEGGPVSMSASGQVDPIKPGRATSEFDQIRDAVTVSLGWQVLGFEEGSGRIDRWMQDLVRTYARPGVQRWLRDKTSLDAQSMPTIRYGVMTATGLPGLKALQINVPARAFDPSIKGSPFTYFIMVLPDGSRTWMAMGADKSVLEKHLRSVKAGGSATIEDKQGLEELRSGRIVTGGYMTMAGIASQASSGLMDAINDPGFRNPKLEQFMEALTRLPNRGETPILFLSQTQEGSPASATIQFKVNRGTIEDLRALILAAGMGQMSTPPRRP